MTDNHGEIANRLRKEWFSERAFQFHNDLRADYERYLNDFRDVLRKQVSKVRVTTMRTRPMRRRSQRPMR
jgi:hypothetical protein